MTRRISETRAARQLALAPLSLLLGALFCVLGMQTAHAQVWESRTDDNGSLIFGTASSPNYRLWFSCNAPSPQGRPLWETGSQEETLNEPFELLMAFSEDLFRGATGARQEGVVLYVGATPFVVPPFDLIGMNGPEVVLSLSEPMVQALYDAPSLRLVTAQGVVHAVTAAGLGTALSTAMQVCVARWADMGHPVPETLSRYRPASATTPAPVPSGPATSIATLPPVIVEHVNAMCGGSARLEEAALRLTDDLDGDGAPDYVIHFSDVFCQPDDTRGFCGAANCSIDVFMSSAGYADPFEFLGLDVSPVKAAGGRLGLALSATPFVCADGACDGVWLWNGRTFALE